MKIKFQKNKNGSFIIVSRDYLKLYNLQDRSLLIEYILRNYKHKKENI
jgi:hypothetical protein